jgi:hypothetical protein
MNLENRLQALIALGELLKSHPERLEECILQTYRHNPWFTPENQQLAIENVVEFFLDESKLYLWINAYPKLAKTGFPKRVGLIMAGNVPLVGFHDVLCVLISGNIALIKCSDKDPFLLPCLAELLIEVAPQFKPFIHFVEKLVDYDAVIATGSNNSARYFEHYFASKPHIIRKNRHAVAVLTGSESEDEFISLGKDIFTYFGLGCRNVSKIYVPKAFDFTPLLDALHSFKEIILHHSYKNNFDYQSAIWLLNKVPHFMTGSILISEEKAISSKIATLHYEFYDSLHALNNNLNSHRDQIQCVIGHLTIPGFTIIPFGEGQKPALSDYADGIDTISFLSEMYA